MRASVLFALALLPIGLLGVPEPARAGSTTVLAAAKTVGDGAQPVRVVGRWTWSSSLVPTHYVEPVVALMNVSRYVRGNHSDWVPLEEQVLGRLEGPATPSPVAYGVNLPVRMAGASVDLDQDGESDPGVQVYALHVASNLTGDSYLFQMDQVAYRSYLADPRTGRIRQGTFLLHAPDDQQGFPGAAGADGQFFTADDPVVRVPAGYTLATLGHDGTVTLERSAEVRMDTLEEAAIATPDFSKQGILESFHSLVDVLAERYAYTELRGLDWKAIREEYRPRVEAADAAGDMAAYFVALSQLGLSLRDGHVGAYTSDAALRTAFSKTLLEPYGASLGALGVELADGRYVVTHVVPDGPAARAGWTFGTEVVSVKGVPMREWIGTLPLQAAAGNPETVRLTQATLALLFADGETVEIAYRQPGEDRVRTSALTAATGLEYPQGPGVPPLFQDRELEGGAYVAWGSFREPAYLIASWERFLGRSTGAPGIVVDMRGNGGGNGELMHTMASYFFSDEHPASFHWLDTYSYDEEAKGLVKAFAQDFPLSAPKRELRFDGAVVVLVDERSASAGEYFPQFLQRHGRAIVVGERGTDGAGGPVGEVILPGNVSFHYTLGRTCFANTQELNLEAKGVRLDVRVPVTLENERAKQEGKDPVLAAAVKALQDEAARRLRQRLADTTWRVSRVFSTPEGPPNPRLPDGTTVSFTGDGTVSIRTGCGEVTGRYAVGPGGTLSITTGPSTVAGCAGDPGAGDLVAWLSTAQKLELDEGELGVFLDGSKGILAILLEATR